MRKLRFGMALLAALLGTPAGAADGPGVLTIRSDETLPMRVNGVEGRMRVDPSAVPRMFCNPDFAMRAKIIAQGRGALLSDPADVFGSFGAVTLQLAGRTQEVRAHWIDQPYVEGADCVIAPGMIGVDAVRFVSGRASRTERTVAMPLNPGGPDSPHWNGAAATAIRVGDRDISVGFSYLQPDNSVTARAALRISGAHGGRYAGDAVRSLSPSGRERQLRRMVLQSPLPIGPLAVTAMQVRVTDWGSAGRIKPVGTIDPPANPDDVMVVAQYEHEETFERLTIGRDQLRRCSSIVVDFRAKEIRLTCG
ncbi:MAG: hypothetical protein V4537_16960 [Pseudomonadota bacterium]